MSKVRNDLFSIGDLIVDDLVETEIDNSLHTIIEAYCHILRLKDSRIATNILLDFLVYDTDLLNLNDIKDWFREQ